LSGLSIQQAPPTLVTPEMVPVIAVFLVHVLIVFKCVCFSLIKSGRNKNLDQRLQWRVRAFCRVAQCRRPVPGAVFRIFVPTIMAPHPPSSLTAVTSAASVVRLAPDCAASHRPAGGCPASRSLAHAFSFLQTKQSEQRKRGPIMPSWPRSVREEVRPRCSGRSVLANMWFQD
jgi:hypothetical protein